MIETSFGILRQCEKMALFRYFQKTLREHFREASNNKSSEIGLSRVESESVAESLEVVKSGKYLTNIQENDTNSCNGMNVSMEYMKAGPSKIRNSEGPPSLNM